MTKNEQLSKLIGAMMGMGPAGVFIVESPGVEEVAGGYGEAPIVTEMLKLIRLPCVSRRSESRVELERDAKIYQQRDFDVLLFSAHGSPGEIALTTGEVIPVAELLSLFRGPTSTTVLFSSCEVMAGDAIAKALARPDAPDYVLGYDTTVYWSSAALASVMLINALATNQFSRMLSTLLAIYQCTQVNVCGYTRTVQSDTHQWFSTKSFVEHARDATGAKTEIELSTLIADYMKKERERFQERTDAYFRQAEEDAEANRKVGKTALNAAQDAIDRLQRPEKPLLGLE
jgi:hypothetical protein